MVLIVLREGTTISHSGATEFYTSFHRSRRNLPSATATYYKPDFWKALRCPLPQIRANGVPSGIHVVGDIFTLLFIIFHQISSSQHCCLSGDKSRILCLQGKHSTTKPCSALSWSQLSNTLEVEAEFFPTEHRENKLQDCNQQPSFSECYTSRLGIIAQHPTSYTTLQD